MNEIDITVIERSESPIEPWQAEIVALTVALSKAGVFTWAEWVDRFSSEIRRAPQTTAETVDQAYYRQWSTCLEALLSELGHLAGPEIARDAEHWKRSYWNTAHGKPIVFSRAHPPISADEDDHDHHHDDDDHHHHHHGHHHGVSRRPVAIAAPLSN